MATCFLVLVLTAGDVEVDRLARELASALKSRDVPALLAGFERLGRENTLDALEVLLDCYAAVEDLPEGTLYQEDRFSLYTTAARAIAGMTDREVLVALPKLALRNRRWGARLILIAGARVNPRVDHVALCIEVLKREKHPVVLREAIYTLGRSKDKRAIEPLIDCWERVKKKLGPPRPTLLPRKRSRRSRGKSFSYRGPEWQRVPIALQEALTRLCGYSLSSPSQYRRLLEHHGEAIDPNRIEKEQKDQSRTFLFGLDLVGKNIIFILDVSGSMETTDPPPPGARTGPRTRAVGGPGAPFIDEERMRITRAKKELKNVIKKLPEDKSFNVIAFSSTVKCWKDHVVPASPANKKAALSFIDDLRPEGITVTDLALEYAFQDPIVDTIYLITDGAPTHQGTYGPGLPPDAPKLIKQIIKRVKVLNFRRGVRIFTLGFPGAEETFLKQLSAEHGGVYRPIR